MYNDIQKAMIQKAKAVSAAKTDKERGKRFRAYRAYVNTHVMKPFWLELMKTATGNETNNLNSETLDSKG